MSTEPDVPIAQPVAADEAAPMLEYARPDSEFTARGEVEAMIDAGRSILRVTAPFRDRADAARYLAGSFARRFSVESAGERCVACDAPTRGLLFGGWWFDVPAQPLRFYVDSGLVRGRAMTTHACCAACAARLDAATATARRVALGARSAIGIGMVVVFVSLVFADNGPLATAVASAGIALAVAGTATLFVNRHLARLRLVPRRLRQRLPGWLNFDGWDGAASR